MAKAVISPGSKMLLTGFGMMQGMAASNTIIQTVVPEDRRARVMSYYTMAFVGMVPCGSLLLVFWRTSWVLHTP